MGGRAESSRIGEDLIVQVVDPVPLSSVHLDRIDQIWRDRPSHLFDGPAYALVSFSPHLIAVARYSYRVFWSQWQDPVLRREVGLLPIGVRGVVRCEGRIAMGRRPQWVGLAPGLLEFAPAGSLDDDHLREGVLDYRGQILQELEEEVGATCESARSITPMMLTSSEMVADLILAIELDRPPTKKGDEYEELFWVEESDLTHFVEGHAEKMVPLSQQIAQEWHTVRHAKQ
jgi:hypothetical protein